ncbi:hypothetical protein FRC18_002861 [Serendipita sp. 400]|nr:hypothetical protein FRC18_002861 [Serendipita sp. 400]
MCYSPPPNLPYRHLSAKYGKLEIRVIARSSSSYEAPPSTNVSVVRFDLDNKGELIQALKGHDVVLLTIGVGPSFEKTSLETIDVAIEAGIKRIISSEFGNDRINASPAQRELFSRKVAVLDYLP